MRLPADFGIEKLSCPLHNNVVVKLPSSGRLVGANSAILALNSPVLDSLFTKQQRGLVEFADLLPPDAAVEDTVVEGFIAALYCGRVALDFASFRGVSLLAERLQVAWLRAKCRRWFERRVEKAGDYEALAWIVEEAARNRNYTELVVEKLATLGPEEGADFLTSYFSQVNSRPANHSTVF